MLQFIDSISYFYQSYKHMISIFEGNYDWRLFIFSGGFFGSSSMHI
jgi:hypothetical protein